LVAADCVSQVLIQPSAGRLGLCTVRGLGSNGIQPFKAQFAVKAYSFLPRHYARTTFTNGTSSSSIDAPPWLRTIAPSLTNADLSDASATKVDEGKPADGQG
jgi:hypothetical protein